MSQPLVGIIMGSSSDWETMRHAAETLDRLGVAHEVKVVSAHRTPKRLYDYASSAKERGLKLIIAGAGGAAHLPGMAASMTSLPVLGVPIESQALKGMDSLLSIVQMPAGVPVGTLAIGRAGAVNAGLLAASILASNGSTSQPSPGGTTSRCPAKPKCGPPVPRIATIFSVGPSGASPITQRWTVKPIPVSASSRMSNTGPLAGVTLGQAIRGRARATGSMDAVIALA